MFQLPAAGRARGRFRLLPGAGEANAGGRSSGVHLLDRWLRQHFEPQWARRSLYLLAVPRKRAAIPN